jgi:membrane-associated phospholipid phosphatase
LHPVFGKSPTSIRARQVTGMAGVSCSVIVARARKRLGLPPAVTTACLFAAPASILAAFRQSKLRDAAAWVAQMLAYKNAFELPNDAPDRLRKRVRVEYPIAVDARIGAGLPTGQRLQRRLRQRGHLSGLDKVITFFYWSWEIEPHAVMAWIRWRHPERFGSAARRLASVFDLTLIGYWSVPTAPPWWASEQEGLMGGEVRRVMDEVAQWVKREPNPTEGDHTLGANPFAAMPSDHFASAAMTAILLAEIDPVLGACGWSYAALLAFALVYLGEHYVIDLVAGLTLTLAVNAAHAGARPNGSAARIGAVTRPALARWRQA